MADTKLILRIDNLAHKLISAESEIAFGETFDIIFEGLEDYSGKTAGVYLDDISGTQSLWGIDAAIQTVDGKACIQNCVINTEEALEVLTFSEVETRISLYLKSASYSTYYGDTKLRLHPGKTDDGETYTELTSSIEQHDADPNSHIDIRTELGNVKRETISSVNTILTDHKSTEEVNRNQAIANAISESEAKLTNAFDTSFAATESRINAKAEEVEGYRGETEAFRDEADTLRDEAKAFRDEAKGAEESAKSIQSAVTDIAETVASQAEVCAKAQEAVAAKTVEVQELANQVTQDAEAVAQSKQTVTTAAATVETLVDGFDSKVDETLENIETASEEAVGEINATKSGAVGEITTVKTDALTAIGDAKINAETALQGKVDAATESITQSTEAATNAATDAEAALAELKDSSIYIFKGSVASVEDLPEEAEVGEVYNIQSDGMNYAWDGERWDALGSTVSDISVDDALSADSTNPIQNQWLGKRMGATSSNSVQIGYNAKAGKTSNQGIDGSNGDDGQQVAVGLNANGSNSGAAVGFSANGYSSGAAVGRSANGSNSGAAVGRSANGYNSGAAVGFSANGSNSGAAVGYGANTGSTSGAVAVGYSVSANSSTPIVIGGVQLASTAQITVSSDGVLKVGGKEVGGGNTEVWNGTIDSVSSVTDDMLGAKPLDNGNYPRLHARNKEIHGCKGFSNETGDYTGLELLLPWDVAMSNETSYLMAGVKFQSDRGFGMQTFVQPLVPKETTAASAYFPYALPAFEDSPIYWKGHFIYSDARQIFLPWDKLDSYGQGTLALTSDIDAAIGDINSILETL